MRRQFLKKAPSSENMFFLPQLSFPFNEILHQDHSEITPDVQSYILEHVLEILPWIRAAFMRTQGHLTSVDFHSIILLLPNK